MSVPSSFSTICTYPCIQELVGLVLSLSIHHPDNVLYIYSDTKSKEYIENVMTPKPRIQIKWKVTLDKYANKNRYQMESQGIVKEFWANKAKCIGWALEENEDVMFLDGDQFVVGRIDGIDKTKQLGVSPHFMPKHITDRYGYYNAGMVWTNTKAVVDRWIQLIPLSRYVDQACVEDLANEFSHFIFGNEYNIQSYRFTQGILPPKEYKKCFSVKNGMILFNGKRVRTFHTHFKRGDSMTAVNNFIHGLLLRAKMWGEAALVDRMLDTYWKLWIPKQPQTQSHWYHNNDSFRMYPKLWSLQNADVQFGAHPTRLNCWLNNSVMLYDRPNLTWMNNEAKLASLVLMGNGDHSEVVETANKYVTNVKSWIFWPRDIYVYVKNRTKKSWDDRKTESIFIGNFENSVQQKYRDTGDWNKYITEFHLTRGHKHKFTKDEYVRKLGECKYGLCMRGFGKKCHREVELMGLGTVPIVTHDVEMDSYLSPPKEGVHYIRVSKPEDIPQKINSITKEKWEEMSKAGIEWFDRNLRWDMTIERILYG